MDRGMGLYHGKQFFLFEVNNFLSQLDMGCDIWVALFLHCIFTLSHFPPPSCLV